MSEPDDIPRAAAAPTFDAIYNAHLGYVWSSLRRLGVRDRDLEDVAHDVFVVVHRRLDDYDPSLPIKPWLFGIAFRVASDYRRKASRRREVLDEPSPAADEELPSDALARAEKRAMVLEALEALPPERRAVFVLHELDEVPMPAIARALELNLNTAYSRLRLARRDFRQAVERLREGER